MVDEINDLREEEGGVAVRVGEGDGGSDQARSGGFISRSKHSSQVQASVESGLAAHGKLEVQMGGHSSSQWKREQL